MKIKFQFSFFSSTDILSSMASTMDGKIPFVIIWVSTSVLKSYQKNVENLARAIIGRLTRVLSTCLRTREVCGADHADSDENNKSKIFQTPDHFIRPQAMKVRRSMSLRWIATPRLIPTSTVPLLRQFQVYHQRFPLKLPGSTNTSRITLETLRPRNTFRLNPVCWNTAETTSHISRTRMEVSSTAPNLSRHINHKNLRCRCSKSVRVFVSQQSHRFSFPKNYLWEISR